MAKAGGDTTTTWILLVEARELVIKAYDGAVQLAERLLVKWLGDGRVRWSCKRLEGPSVSDLATLAARKREEAAAGLFFFHADIAYSEGDPAFWHTGLDINWQENWAHEMYVVGGNKAHGIRAVREDVLAVLLEELGEHGEASAPPRQHQTETRSAKSLIGAEVKRRAAAGERWDSITELSISLHGWMKTVLAAEVKAGKPISAKPLKPRTIENYVRGDLWLLISKN